MNKDAGAGNPLPRRSAQQHMEPQLRRSGGARAGTPFDPFAVDEKTGDTPAGDNRPEEADEAAGAVAGEAAEAAERTPAAEFKKGSRRGRRS